MPAPQVAVVHRQRPGLASLHAATPASVEVTCGRADARRPCSSWAALRSGFTASIRPTAPATTGVEKLVPKYGK